VRTEGEGYRHRHHIGQSLGRVGRRPVEDEIAGAGVDLSACAAGMVGGEVVTPDGHAEGEQEDRRLAGAAVATISCLSLQCSPA
jgi:hypothetical protein